MFAGDFFQSLGLGMTLRWVIEGKAYIDDYCKAAGTVEMAKNLYHSC
jgi:hypothetical protein